MKKIFYLLSLLLFLVYCSKSPIIPENTDPDLDALGILIDSLGNYIDSLGNVVIIDDNGNIIPLGIAVDSLGNYIDSLGNTVILDSLGHIIIVDSVLFGCTQVTACNYNALANLDDGSCIMPDGCTDPLAFNYNPLALCDDGSCIYQLFQSCLDATGEWQINPACPLYVLPILGIEIDIEDRFDDNMYIACDSNRLYINFGSNQTAYADIDDVGELTIPDQQITLDLQNEGYGFLDVNIHGDGNIISGGIGVLNITFVFEILPGSTDSTSCILSIEKNDGNEEPCAECLIALATADGETQWEILNASGGTDFCGQELVDVESSSYVYTVTDTLYSSDGIPLPPGEYGPGSTNPQYEIHCEDHGDHDH